MAMPTVDGCDGCLVSPGCKSCACGLHPPRPSIVWALVAASALFSAAAAIGPPAAAPPASPAASPTPLFAYYYIWFNPSSWNRAKVDYPLLGRYSSDDRAVMRRHIEEAKAAGIGGFLVSWKNTDQLDRRLAKLIQVTDA